jgi:6-phosphofructokinase 1
VKAVESLLEGKSNYMVGLQNDKVNLTPLEQAIKGKSEIDRELLRVSDIMSIINKTEAYFASIK